MLALDEHPEEAAAVRADRSLLPGRDRGVHAGAHPFNVVARATTTVTRLGDHDIPAATRIRTCAGDRHPAEGSTMTGVRTLPAR